MISAGLLSSNPRMTSRSDINTNHFDIFIQTMRVSRCYLNFYLLRLSVKPLHFVCVCCDHFTITKLQIVKADIFNVLIARITIYTMLFPYIICMLRIMWPHAMYYQSVQLLR